MADGVREMRPPPVSQTQTKQRAHFQFLWHQEVDPWMASMAVALQEPIVAAFPPQGHHTTTLAALFDLFLTTVAGGRAESPPT